MAEMKLHAKLGTWRPRLQHPDAEWEKLHAGALSNNCEMVLYLV